MDGTGSQARTRTPPEERSPTSTSLDDGHPGGNEIEQGRIPTWRLEDELATPAFAVHGWDRLVGLADYLSELVDGRTVGNFAIDDPQTFDRLVGLASLIKAAAQWYALDQDRPRFLVEAERYLADSLHGKPVLAPPPILSVPSTLRTGPVVSRKGGHGPRGRLRSVRALADQLVEMLLKELTNDDLRIHLAAYRDGLHRAPLDHRHRPKQKWVLPWAVAENVMQAFAEGTLADLLREHKFTWHYDAQLDSISAAVADVLEQSALGEPGAEGRLEELERIAETMIKAALRALYVPVPRDVFRDRTSRRSRE